MHLNTLSPTNPLPTEQTNNGETTSSSWSTYAQSDTNGAQWPSVAHEQTNLAVGLPMLPLRNFGTEFILINGMRTESLHAPLLHYDTSSLNM
jgi:hypothetical protein